MVCSISFLLALGSQAPEADAVFAGVAFRAPALEAQAERIAIALGQALERAGFTDLGPQPPQPDDVHGDDGIRVAVERGRAHYLDGEFTGALEQADAAIERFESELAFQVGPVWSQLAEALVVRSLALGRLDRGDEANEALTRLATLMPEAPLDPELAPPNVVARHQALRAELNRAQRVQLEVVSEPPGATVVVDGRTVGRAPLVVGDLLPGTHYVAMVLEGERVGRRVTVSSGTLRVQERVGDVRTPAARALRTLLAAAVAQDALTQAAASVADDAVCAALLPTADGTAVVAVRTREGNVAVTGALLAPDADIRATMRLVVAALVDGRAGWVGDAAPGSGATPAELLFRDSESSDGWLWVLLGVGGSALAVAAAAAAAAAALTSSAPSPLEIVVDASRL